MAAIGSFVLVDDNRWRSLNRSVNRMLLGYCHPWIEYDGQCHATDGDDKNRRQHYCPKAEAQWLQ